MRVMPQARFKVKIKIHIVISDRLSQINCANRSRTRSPDGCRSRWSNLIRSFPRKRESRTSAEPCSSRSGSPLRGTPSRWRDGDPARGLCSEDRGSGTGLARVDAPPVASAFDVVLDQAPDAVLDGVEARLALQAERARALDRDRDLVLDPARPPGEDHDAVRQIDRLVDLVGDEQHGLSRLQPDPQELLLHQLAGLMQEE